MKAIKKLLYFLAVAGTTMFASSCTEEMDYTPAPRPAGQQVYFATDMSETVNLEENSSSVTIPVYRVVADEAASFSIFATEESSFRFPRRWILLPVRTLPIWLSLMIMRS